MLRELLSSLACLAETMKKLNFFCLICLLCVSYYYILESYNYQSLSLSHSLSAGCSGALGSAWHRTQRAAYFLCGAFLSTALSGTIHSHLWGYYLHGLAEQRQGAVPLTRADDINGFNIAKPSNVTLYHVQSTWMFHQCCGKMACTRSAIFF